MNRWIRFAALVCLAASLTACACNSCGGGDSPVFSSLNYANSSGCCGESGW